VQNPLLQWPLIRQILTRTDGTGVEAMSDRTRNLRARNQGTEVTRSILPVLRRRLRTTDLSQGRQTGLH
jgi:hypothetical protein